MPSQIKSITSLVRNILIIGIITFVLGLLFFTVLAFIAPKTEDGNPDINKLLASDTKKLINGDFIIKTPPEKEIIINAPQMLQLSQEKIEEEIGKSKPMQVVDGVEEKAYLVESNNQQEFEVNFGYFNNKPLYCRFYFGGDGVSDWQTALKLVGVDTGGFNHQEVSPGMNYWYRGEFENRLFDLTAIIEQVDDITINKGIDFVVVKIYLPDEIVFDAEQIIGKAKAGVLGKREIERIKNKLKTISRENVEFNIAQQLIKEIDEISPELTF